MTSLLRIDKIWITWHFQARTRNIAQELNIPVYEFFKNDNLAQRHFLSSLWTIKILLTRRPTKIIIQCSFMLLLIVAVYKILYLKKVILVVDCHTKALRRKAPGVLNYIFWPLKKFSFKYTDLTIISNTGLIDEIKELHDNYMILPDKIPEIKVTSDKAYPFKYCVYISSFAIDEPFEEILEVSKILNHSVKIFWTGKYNNKVKTLQRDYPNIEFTGYIPFNEYYNLLGNADCALALTTEEDCLQSGAYEALGLEVPFVVSDTKALQTFFQDAAIYTKHAPECIADAVIKSINSSEELRNRMRALKKIKMIDFNSKLHHISNLLKNNITL